MFVRIPANNRSLAQRKLIHGVATNDAWYRISNSNGRDPCYNDWIHIVHRCYDPSLHKKRPKYEQCTMSPELLFFSNFIPIWDELGETNLDLVWDKDICIPGNTVYSREAIARVTAADNGLLLDCGAARGLYAQGVSYDERRSMFRARCKVNGVERWLGYFKTEAEAALAYNGFKADLLTQAAYRQIDPRVKKGFLKHAKLRLNAPSPTQGLPP